MRRVLFLSFVLLAGCTRSAAAPTDPGAATVVEVVDGDTVVVDIGGQQETLRLIGVDTPETVDPDRRPSASARRPAPTRRSCCPRAPRCA